MAVSTNIAIVLTLLIEAQRQAAALTAAIAKANAEGRDIGPQELADLRVADDSARKALQDAIDAA